MEQHLHRTPLYKLNMNVVPLKYDIRMRPNFNDYRRFDANLETKVKVLEACNEILMHAVKLNLKDVEFKTNVGKSKSRIDQKKLELLIDFLPFVSGTAFKPEKILHDEENEIVKIFFGNKNVIPTGEGVLCIKYDGDIYDRELKGMYRNEWNQDVRDMKDKCWIMTKLDGCQARMVMPCWDEPEFKANFKFQVELPEDLDCLFNEIQDREERINGGLKRVS